MSDSNLGKYQPDLLPCPFCGHEARLNGPSEYSDDGGGHKVQIECTECYAKMTHYKNRNYNRRDYYANWDAFETQMQHYIATQWNRRVP